MTTVVKPKSKVNVELLNETLAYIETHPEDWDQGSYRCESGMCFAGWAATLVGGQWLTFPDSLGSNLMVALPGDAPIQRDAVHVHDRAQRVLGLTEAQADYLFCGSNQLEDIRRIVAELTA